MVLDSRQGMTMLKGPRPNLKWLVPDEDDDHIIRGRE